MNAFRRYVRIEEPGRVVLDDLPFRAGQRVEVLLIADEEAEARIETLRALLAETQSLAKARNLTEEEIAEEIAAYRAGR